MMAQLTTQRAAKSNQTVLAVFFEGTANTMDPMTTQIGLFASACDATHVTHPSDISSSNSPGGPFKMAFDGCGVTNGLRGALFAAGLEGQCKQVVLVVKALLDQPPQQQQPHVHVVAVGLSRGGMACMKLAHQLAPFPLSQVSLSMLLFDPVPGNALCTKFPFTAALAGNLTHCHNLQRVLAMYPHEPLPDLAMHAPTLPRYPPHTQVEEDVTLGCHQGSLCMTSLRTTNPYEIASNLSFRRLLDFLQSEGLSCHFSKYMYQPTVEDCLDLYRKALMQSEPSIRRTHDHAGLRRMVVRDGGEVECRFLNKHHEQLEEAVSGENTNLQNATAAAAAAAAGGGGVNSKGRYQLRFEVGQGCS